jgi:glycosyltransferase involved in cell wall biosynthesis
MTTFGLAMIVRDEAENLPACIDSVRDLISWWTILDTGSTDNTKELVGELLDGIPGGLAETAWRGFGPCRTELMRAAHGTADYLILLDADMVVHHNGIPPLTADVYMGRIRGSLDYQLPILVRGDKEWVYEGVAHSYLKAVDGQATRKLLPGLEIEDRSHTTRAKLLGDVKLLSEDHARDPLNARTVFYLAQTYYDLDMVDEAIHYYRLRAHMDGWAEETFYARYRLGCLLCEHKNYLEGARVLLDAWEDRPGRAETLRVLAHASAAVADKIPYPADTLFVHRNAYKQPAPAFDWDQWRADYPNLSFKAQQDIYATVAEHSPDQNRFDEQSARAFLQLAAPSRVVEVGGWRGELAAALLPDFPTIKSWANHEIAPNLEPSPTDQRYRHHILTDWPWKRRMVGDALVLSHVVEHMQAAQFGRLLSKFTGDWVYIDCPVSDDPPDWTGYDGSHVIEVGWSGLTLLLNHHGFTLAGQHQATIRSFKRSCSKR